MCVCVSVFFTLGQDVDFKKLSKFFEIWYTCKLGKYLGCFFYFFKIFIFGPWGPMLDRFGSKNFGAIKIIEIFWNLLE